MKHFRKNPYTNKAKKIESSQEGGDSVLKSERTLTKRKWEKEQMGYEEFDDREKESNTDPSEVAGDVEETEGVDTGMEVARGREEADGKATDGVKIAENGVKMERCDRGAEVTGGRGEGGGDGPGLTREIQEQTSEKMSSDKSNSYQHQKKQV